MSPLLTDEIIEREYTKGIESQVSGPVAPDPGAPAGSDGVPIPGTSGQQISPGAPSPGVDESGEPLKLDPDAEKMHDATREFTFSETPPSGATPAPGAPGATILTDEDIDKDGEAFVLPDASAKSFANMVGDSVGIYVPKFCYDAVKIDISNIKFHVRKGNLLTEDIPIFEDLNTEVKQKLKFDPEEITMLKKATKEYLAYKNFEFVNPETAFFGTLGILGVSQWQRTQSIKKELNRIVLNIMKMRNPSLFKDYKDEEQARQDLEDHKDKEPKKDKTL